jgi:competence protein ComEA
VDQADARELTRLPRIGPALAQRIVAWRAEHGPFGGLGGLDSVPGVGPRLLEAVRHFVTFSGVIPPAP